LLLLCSFDDSRVTVAYVADIVDAVEVGAVVVIEEVLHPPADDLERLGIV
jgi:hypothetical protein